MDGLNYDQLPDEVKEALAAEAGGRAEAEGLQKEYGELIELSEVIQAQNRAIIEDTLQAYSELEGEMFGD